MRITIECYDINSSIRPNENVPCLIYCKDGCFYIGCYHEEDDEFHVDGEVVSDISWFVLLDEVYRRKEKKMDSDIYSEKYRGWLLILSILALSGGDYKPIIKEDFEDYIERKKKEEDTIKLIRDNCSAIEWEQDMGAHIPFCRLDGDFCNMQCMRK